MQTEAIVRGERGQAKQEAGERVGADRNNQLP